MRLWLILVAEAVDLEVQVSQLVCCVGMTCLGSVPAYFFSFVVLVVNRGSIFLLWEIDCTKRQIL